MASSAKNKFCRSSDLSNEASVESFFVLRLLASLGYQDREIKTKQAIQELRVAKGRSQEPYRPDFLIVCGNKPRWLIDAKSPEEHIEDFTYQGAGYALQINRKYGDRPLRYYMLTSGFLTRIYVWDQEEAILSLRFGDVVDGNAKYETLVRLLSADAARAGWEGTVEKPPEGRVLVRPNMDAVKKAFLRCHKIIWKSEKMSPQAAFVEFAKLLFVKLWEDRRLRDNPSLLERITKGEPLPLSEIRFSTPWIESQEKNDPHPMDALLFHQLVESLENEIVQRKRKRIFEAQERLRLSPGTAKRVVKELEDYYLFGIDEDLNGRMFEAFLAATMRGQALGQYFTPRTIVKLMTRIAGLRAGAKRKGAERVVDACCGTGGFLIEALTEMRLQIWNNQSLTTADRNALLEEVANQAIFGIDAGRDPMIARIARINMYLHGDGGSRVYMADALRHPPEPSAADSPEVKGEVEELRRLLDDGVRFDVALTNPPFSMDYSAGVPEEKEVLATFDLATYAGKKRRSLRSSVMFLERYHDLLRPGGRLLTVIDDSVLAGDTYAFVREFIRERFIIRGIISLHGDAFQRAGARAKTSVLYLVKKSGDPEETQPAAFVYESRYIGLDDKVPRTRQSILELARRQASDEVEEIATAFASYWAGNQGEWLVPSNRLDGRLDAKYLRPWSTQKLKAAWQAVGITADVLGNIVDPVDDPIVLDAETRYTFLRISYEGRAERGDTALGKEVSYSKVGRTKVGDVIVSNISAVYRAICVVPVGMDDLLLSNEFTVLRLKPGAQADPYYLLSILRSTAVIAQWISSASGVGRHRVDWSMLRDQLVPLLPLPEQHRIGELYKSSMEHEAGIIRDRAAIECALSRLDLENEDARDRMIRAKPPK